VPGWGSYELRPQLQGPGAGAPIGPPCGGGGALQGGGRGPPPLGARPPSRQDVDRAQPHLVLLKSKLRERRRHESSVYGIVAEDRSVRLPSGGTPRVEQSSGLQPAAAGEVGEYAGAPKATPPGGLGRPREVPRARGVELSPRGVTWDPPCAPHEARPEAVVPPQKGLTPRPLRSETAARPDLQGYPGRCVGAEHPFNTVPMAPTLGTPTPLSHPAVGAPAATFLPAEATAGGDGPLVPCPDCGRSFCKESLTRHLRICKKVFQQKRKQFSSAASRLGDLENAGDLIANAQRLEREKTRGSHGTPAQAVPKWKQKSLAFRQAILAAKAASGDEAAQMKADIIQQKLDAVGGANSDMTQCPHCGRTFNKEAGERHIAICVKTFGNKPGGGRLVKGGGRVAAAAAAAPGGGAQSAGLAAEVPPPWGGNPSAMSRKPLANCSRAACTQGAPPAAGALRAAPPMPYAPRY